MNRKNGFLFKYSWSSHVIYYHLHIQNLRVSFPWLCMNHSMLLEYFPWRLQLVCWDLQEWLVLSDVSRQTPARRVDSFIGTLWNFYATCRETGKTPWEQRGWDFNFHNVLLLLLLFIFSFPVLCRSSRTLKTKCCSVTHLVVCILFAE